MSDSDVYRMPWERGGDTSSEPDSENLLGILDSEEEDPGKGGGQKRRGAKRGQAEEDEDDGARGEDDEEEEEGDPDDESDGDGEPDDDANRGRTYKVRVDGGEVEVTLAELLKGYSREADYTRKTQALAETRKTELGQLQGARERYIARLTELEDALLDIGPAEPDAKLRTENPAEYAAQWAEYQRHQQDLAAVRAERRAETEKAMEDRAREMQTVLREEGEKLVAAIPEWRDPEKAAEGKRHLVTYAKGLGFTEADLAGVSDHRLLVILHKAARYDRLQGKRTTIQKKAKEAPVLKPGGRESANPSKGQRKRAAIEKAKQRLQRTGRDRDAAAIIENMLD